MTLSPQPKKNDANAVFSICLSLQYNRHEPIAGRPLGLLEDRPDDAAHELSIALEQPGSSSDKHQACRDQLLLDG